MDTARPRVAIIGAGVSGLAMAAALMDAGMEDHVVFEKAQDVGGTWRENRYPGLTCDVPGRFYQLRDHKNPDWSHVFAPGPEIHAYLRRFADERGLRERIRFGAEIVDARWQDERWHLRTDAGEEETFDVVVAATGVLHRVRMPQIEGMETFAGPAFHSARWDDTVDLRGTRVAVVGTGSTACQIVGALAGEAAHVDVYQRSRHWVVQTPNPAYTRATKRLMRRIPRLNDVAYRFWGGTLFDWLGQAPVVPGPRRRVAQACVRWQLRRAVKDPALRARITPDYEPFCNRLIVAPNYLRALQRPDVDLVDGGISRIEPAGIRGADGVLREADVIVYATGFDAQAFMRPMTITGAGQITLEEAWAGGPRAYRSVALPGFPNLFTLQGPHSPVGNSSLIAIAETQIGWVMQWLERMRAGEIAWTMPREDVTAAYYAEMEQAFPHTTWAGGCRSWYQDADGKVAIWAWTIRRHRQLLDRIEPTHFETGVPARSPQPVG